MTDLLVYWHPSEKEGDVIVRTDFCCPKAAEAYKFGALIFMGYAMGLELVKSPYVDVAKKLIIAYCPFCGGKVISINDATGERTNWAAVLEEKK